MTRATTTMHADQGTWSAFTRRLDDLLELERADSDELVELASVFVTGSLASGEGIPGESDLDLTIGITASHPEEYHATVVEQVEEHENELIEALDLPVTSIHVVGVCDPKRAAHRAMQTQHEGNELARQHGDEQSPMLIYDAVTRKEFNDARDAADAMDTLFPGMRIEREYSKD